MSWVRVPSAAPYAAVAQLVERVKNFLKRLDK